MIDSPTPGAGAAHLFVYGSLVDPRRLDAVLGHRFSGERLRARLEGFERIGSAELGYPYLVEQPTSFVDGVLIMDLSPGDLDVLDRYEDVDTGVYERIVVEVEAWGCGPRPAHLEAHTYVGGSKLRSTAS
jgi:gamma-glutamylcyclotransferase (GGCT)/AIG2-like uncharacterized protein YtfP